ncbi:conserved hypothetical protein [Leishmania major strain Friedlin]|uniref:Uncharacterized protein n=1 Tax=Leishmania major TaxID=5664 RepID=E9AD95_LEIMA|nr:conserved hypothetical protein [Leishmania major strain Friedlin]CAG9576721.1 hypothetical_protein_-_conserved [Leishmania major strain Friedlin]CBZ12181.1 conserved hypothetical protein [Leishmania major strain Friedlin]|eukprot:XP_003721924.1 conserved hypothetical protein [Leishmania major strain Friedlin]
MSGAGRKHRAKHLTQQYLDASGWVGPKEGERLAICMESPHGQHVRVLLLVHPNSAPASSSTEAPAPDGSSSSDAPHGAKESEAGVSASPPSAAPLLEVEQVVHLPRKFHKVIWLSIKDVVVIADGTVSFKPSPEQVESFLKDPRNKGWRERVATAQHRAEDQRAALQRMPHYAATAQTTTSVLTGPQVRSGVRATANGTSEQDSEGSEGEADDMRNPNWRNIKHQQHFFYGLGDDSDEIEEEEDA